MNILVADDDAVYRSVLNGLLTEWQFNVLLASDGQEAMEVMTGEDSPPLILLDGEMPRMDGYEVAREIRQNEICRDAYVIMITGKATKEDLSNVLVSGADEYLLKPCEPLELKIRLRTAMRVLSLQKELDELGQYFQQEPV